MKVATLCVLLAGLLVTTQSLCEEGKPIEYPIGVPAFEQLELLPLLPPNGTQTKQFISYDTSGGNDDGGGRKFQRYVQDGEWVFFDEIGPGCLYRLQMNVFCSLNPAADTARIRFRFDDEKEPRIDMTFAEFFGKGGKYTAPFTPPLAYFDMLGTQWSPRGGSFAILYHPFPFQKRLRISVAHPEALSDWKNWYQFTYLKFPAGTKADTWTGKNSDDAAWRAQWENLGKDPKSAIGVVSTTQSAVVKKGEHAILLDQAGTGSLTRLNLTMKPWNANTFTKVRLRFTWDDHVTPDIDLPIGCFFGGGGDTLGKDVSAKALKTLLFGYDGLAGTGYSYWPMPYWKRAKIEVFNDSQEDLETISLATDRKDMQSQPYPQRQCGYFCAKRTLDVSPVTSYYSRAFHQRGFGKVVGLMMYSVGYSMDGDEFTYIDGSRTPQIHGDGTEDDHNQGFGGYAIQKPLWGGLINGFDGAYRMYLAEPYVFNSEIKINYEHSNLEGGHGGQKTDFIVWYYLGEPGIANVSLTDELDVGDTTSEQAHSYEVQGQTWSGLTKASYDIYEQGDPYPTSSHGCAFTNAMQFTVRIDPDNEGVRLRRRLNRNLANVQQAKVFVNGAEIPDTPWYFCDLPTPPLTAFADTDFEIPAAYTSGRKQLTIRIEHVKAEPANATNAYHFQVYCYGRKPLPPPLPEPASQPEKFRATATEDKAIRLDWVASTETPADRFRLERRGSNEKEFVPIAECKATAINYYDRTVATFETYTYRLRAVNAGGSSDWVEASAVIIDPAATNLLRTTVASASSEYDANYTAAMACDGDLTTRWNSAKGLISDQWLAFRLPAPKRISAVLIYQTTQWTRITDYRIQVWDAGEWKDVFRGDTMPDVVACRFKSVTTNQIRIWIGKTTGNTPTLNEVQAFDLESVGH